MINACNEWLGFSCSTSLPSLVTASQVSFGHLPNTISSDFTRGCQSARGWVCDPQLGHSDCFSLESVSGTKRHRDRKLTKPSHSKEKPPTRAPGSPRAPDLLQPSLYFCEQLHPSVKSPLPLVPLRSQSWILMLAPKCLSW